MNYIVKRGDTLSKIASRYSTSAKAIAAANGIANISRIYAGQSLVINNSKGQTQSFNNQNPLALTGGESRVQSGGGVMLPQSIAPSYSYDDSASNGASVMVNTPNKQPTDFMPYILIGGGLLVLFMVMGKGSKGVTRHKRRR